MADGMTTAELATYMQTQILKTFDVFSKNRGDDTDYNAASWARGRVDAYFEILGWIDPDRLETLQLYWKQVVDGENISDDD